MTLQFIGPEAAAHLDWLALARALEDGHLRPRGDIRDSFLYRGDDTVLSRAAWIDGLGIAVKTALLFPGNLDRGLPNMSGIVTLFDDATGQPSAILDFMLVTKWKTAADSLLAALKLAPPGVETILLVGAGRVSASMIEAYSAGFPDAKFEIWNRSPGRAEAMTSDRVTPVRDLAEAVGRADIVATATMSTNPVIRGDWITPGTHLDLIGAYRSDMREVDDAAISKAALFVDSRETTLAHIGEMLIPIGDGVISEQDVRADFYDIASGAFTRPSPEAITIAKNGGGAHLDLMTAHYIRDAVPAT